MLWQVGSAIRRTFLLENEADMRENRLAAEVRRGGETELGDKTSRTVF